MAIDATDPDWVRKQLEWLTAPRPSLQERLARGRDRVQDQFSAAERAHYARLQNQAAQGSPSMGPPHGTHSTPYPQHVSAPGAQKRKEPDWNTNAYANGQPAQRQRVPIPRANPSPCSAGPQGRSFPNPGQRSSMPAYPSTLMGASHAWNPAYSISQNRGPAQPSPVALNGSSHGMPSQNHQRSPVPQPDQRQAHAPAPTSAPASAPATTVTQESQPHMTPSVRSLSFTAPSSPVTIKQEIPTSNPAQRSSTEPHAHNSRSTTIEAGSPSGPISGISSPRRDDSLDTHITQLPEARSDHRSLDFHQSSSPAEVQRSTPSLLLNNAPSAHITPRSSASPGINSTEASASSPAVGNSDAGESHSTVDKAVSQSTSSSTNGPTASPTVPNAGRLPATKPTPAAVQEQSHERNSTSHGSCQSAEGARPAQSAEVTNASKPSVSPHLNTASLLNTTDSQAQRPPPENVATHENQPFAAAAAPSPGASSGTARASPESPLMAPLDRRSADEAMPATDTVIDETSIPDDSMDIEDVHAEAAGDTSPPEVDAAQPQANSPKETANDAGSAVRSNPSAEAPESNSRASSSSLSSLVESPSEPSNHGSPEIDSARQKEPHPSVASSTSCLKENTSYAAAASKASAQTRGSESRTTSPSAASADFRNVPKSPVADRSPPNTGSGTRESLPVRRPSDNVWSDRRRPSARQVSPAAKSSKNFSTSGNMESKTSSESAIRSSADIRHRLEKNWPGVNLKSYEAFSRNMLENIAALAAKGIPERVVRAHINMEALLRMEKKTKKLGANISGDPYPTDHDCSRVKDKYWSWQTQKKNSGVAPKQFPLPDGNQAERLLRKLAVQTSRDGFLEYQNEHAQPTGAEKSRNTQRAQPERTGQALLAPGPRRQLKRPAWYTSIKPQEWQSKSRHAGYTGVDAKLSKIKRLMRDCAEKRLDAFDDIRRELHQLAFLEVNKIVVRKTQMLHEDTGLPQLFAAEYSKGVDYPWDIQADALELYNRWCLQMFSTDLLRGIVKSQIAHNRSTNWIDPGYLGKSDAAYYSQGDLVNGQWWPTQLCTVRDGAHGSTQGGIYSVKGKAAFSIVVSGGSQYNDRDEGHELWYSGTNSTDGKYTENTQSLILSIEDKKPVRVIRSHNIHKGASKYRPARGFRYDGLYDVVAYQVVDESKKACLFHMVRRPDQDPIRAEGKAMRPTEEEIAEYDKIKKELNEVGSEM